MTLEDNPVSDFLGGRAAKDKFAFVDVEDPERECHCVEWMFRLYGHSAQCPQVDGG